MSEVNEPNRREAITRALQAYRERGDRRTMTIEYRGADIDLEVIRLPLKLVVLNHDNSRLNAQLADHPDRDLVYNNPTSTAAQSVLSVLLARTERFKNLKEELKELGQQEPGLITRDGLLINGNTRVAALRLLEAEGVKGADAVNVGVLPEDALADDFLDIEMALQMRRLTHQDYTFTNQLLLIDRYRSRGHSEEELARRMGWVRKKKKKCEEAQRLLQLVREIRSLTNPHLAYEVFDAKSQHLKDLDEAYQLTATTDLREANAMKWSRVIGMFLNLNKDRTREIDDEFFEISVLDRLQHKPEIREKLEGFRHVQLDDNLDDLLEDDASAELIDLKGIAKWTLQELSDDEGFIRRDLPSDLQEIHDAMYNEAVDRITAEQKKKTTDAPVEALHETRIRLEKILDDFDTAISDPSFNSGDFEYQLKKVEKRIQELKKKFDDLSEIAK